MLVSASAELLVMNNGTIKASQMVMAKLHLGGGVANWGGDGGAWEV